MFNRRFRNTRNKENDNNEQNNETETLSNNIEVDTNLNTTVNPAEENEPDLVETKEKKSQVVNNVLTNTAGLEKTIIHDANNKVIRELQRTEQETNPELLEGVGLSIFIDKKERKYLLYEITYDINDLSKTTLKLLKSSNLREEIIDAFKMKAGNIFHQLYK
jgi:hypothetical protein